MKNGLIIRKRGRRISYRSILQETIRRNAFSELYGREVLPYPTRTIRLLGKKCSAQIMYTFLGFEVKAGRKRIHCPDIVTARYLKVFSELGCRSIRLPYDPTRTAQIVPQFEAMMDEIHRYITDHFSEEPSTKRRVLQRVYALLRRQIHSATVTP